MPGRKRVWVKPCEEYQGSTRCSYTTQETSAQRMEWKRANHQKPAQRPFLRLLLTLFSINSVFFPYCLLAHHST